MWCLLCSPMQEVGVVKTANKLTRPRNKFSVPGTVLWVFRTTLWMNDLKTTYKGLNSRLNWPKNSTIFYCIGFCVEELIASLSFYPIFYLHFSSTFLLNNKCLAFHVKNPLVQVYLASHKKQFPLSIYTTVVPWVLPFELQLPRQWIMVYN